MAISKSHSKKAPSQSPTAFYKGEQSSKVGSVPQQLKGGPMREQVYGKKSGK